MVFVKKGTGERRDGDDKEVREHPERFVRHGDDYMKHKREKEREAARARRDRRKR